MRRAITKTEAIIVEEMKKTFQARQEKNPRYSLRAFARSLEIEASNLSEILSGKRALTVFVADKILAHLDCSRERALHLQQEFKSEVDKAKQARKHVTNSELQMEEDTFHQISTWYHMAILTFFETAHYDGTPESVAKYFGLPLATTQRALETLTELGLLGLEDGKYRKLAQTYKAPKEDPSGRKRIGTEQVVMDAIDLSVERGPLYQHSEKEYWAQFMSFNPSRMAEAKNYFREAVIKFITSFTAEAGEESEVFQLSFQMFPLKGAGHSTFPENSNKE
ncbi:TIGR02147 family protein [Bdellovibrio sp. NC01]|uniref:TIGR02147 family protein n=1 Tax=Bdellovibrio sp. NC01 TaxID=2220073 RepID=UPI00115BCDEF|nr:hypothetical protein DOE51_14450 [Bdellovibrio sp. NC01]